MPAEVPELTMRDHDEAMALWRRVGWVERTNVRLISATTAASPNA